jgi:hypothetical protein
VGDRREWPSQGVNQRDGSAHPAAGDPFPAKSYPILLTSTTAAVAAEAGGITAAARRPAATSTTTTLIKVPCHAGQRRPNQNPGPSPERVGDRSEQPLSTRCSDTTALPGICWVPDDQQFGILLRHEGSASRW